MVLDYVFLMCFWTTTECYGTTVYTSGFACSDNMQYLQGQIIGVLVFSYCYFLQIRSLYHPVFILSIEIILFNLTSRFMSICEKTVPLPHGLYAFICSTENFMAKPSKKRTDETVCVNGW